MNSRTKTSVALAARKSQSTTTRRCRICGCSDQHACYSETRGTCWWVADDLCSHCVAAMDFRDLRTNVRRRLAANDRDSRIAAFVGGVFATCIQAIGIAVFLFLIAGFAVVLGLGLGG